MLKNNAFDTVFQDGHLEINQQSKLIARCFKIGNDLCSVNWGELIHSLQFHYQFAIDQQVNSAFANRFTLVDYVDWNLPLEGYAQAFQFQTQCFFIYRFQKSGPEFSMHFNSSTDYSLR